jgi:hypothetical protein
MGCDCTVCNGRDVDNEGIIVADKEVIPYVKRYILKMTYPNSPFPSRYRNLLPSLLAYGQAIAHGRAHNSPVRKYFTGSRLMLEIKDQLNTKFTELIIADVAEMADENVQEVCEYNAG